MVGDRRIVYRVWDPVRNPFDRQRPELSASDGRGGDLSALSLFGALSPGGERIGRSERFRVDTYAARPPQDQVDDLILDLLPRQGQWGDEEYLWLTDHSNRLIELTDGYLEVLPMPTDRHQSLLLFVYDLLRVFMAGRGKILVAPLRVRIRERKYREPDLLMVVEASDPRRGNRYWTGADLVIEIVSPDQPWRDLVEKRADYAEARIPEYWIIHPVEETVRVLRLAGEEFEDAGTYCRGNQASSSLLQGFKLDVNALFDSN